MVIGAIVVMSAMTMSFIERTREFGILAAVGWTRWRVGSMIVAEAALIGLLGMAGGVGLGMLAIVAIQNISSLQGVLHPTYTTSVFARGLVTAVVMVLVGALVPAVRAAVAAPLEALRHE